ncbi:MAG: hypothetical protein LBL13_09650 [Bacteroidales bacterium]|jgi:hypothetical protein|nr:hypothetical protein [Bacteroidales bacterium]
MVKTVFYPILLIVCLLFTSCKRCKEDEIFKHEFFNCIRVVEKTQKETYMSSLECRAFSIECLYAMTGYEGHVDKWTQPYYFYPYSDTIEYIDVDIAKWQEWYENNKCTFTIQMADSLFKNHATKYGFPGLHWPISADSLVTDTIYGF